MKAGEAGLRLIMESEGLRLSAYLDTKAGRVPTIGWGHTRGVRMGMTCTREQARQWLEQDVADAEECVSETVRVPLSQPEFSALVSFVFNIGCPQWRRSTLLRVLNAGDRAAAAAQFDRWIYDNGQRQGGLVTRRRKERYLFEFGVLPEQAPAPVEEREMPVPAWLATLGFEMLRSVPDMIGMAKDPNVDRSEKNLNVLAEIARVGTRAVGAENAQRAVEALQDDPQAKDAVAAALRASYFDLARLASEGVQKAREQYSAERTVLVIDTKWLRLNFMHVVSLMILTAAYALGAWILGGEIGVSSDTKALVIGILIAGSVQGVIAFWFNTTASSDWKNRVIAGKAGEG